MIEDVNNIKEGEIYVYDIENNTGQYPETYTVKVKGIKRDRGVVLVESVQTGEVFVCGAYGLSEIEKVIEIYKKLVQVDGDKLQGMGGKHHKNKVKRYEEYLSVIYPYPEVFLGDERDTEKVEDEEDEEIKEIKEGCKEELYSMGKYELAEKLEECDEIDELEKVLNYIIENIFGDMGL